LLSDRINDPHLASIDLLVSPYALIDCDPSVLRKTTGNRAAAMRPLHGIAILYTLRPRNNRGNPDFFKGISRFVAQKGQSREGLVGDGGFEPPTSTMSTWRSTPELIALKNSLPAAAGGIRY
jgi:hypothetical protein